MGVRLSENEAWAAVGNAHTGILTTLRADGRPVTLPTWFVVDARTICLSTPATARKATRARHDPRAAFLVESGEYWRELRAVHLEGMLETVTDPDAHDRIRSALDEKYGSFRVARDRMPARTQSHYAAPVVVLRFVPSGKILSWDNRRLTIGA